MELFDAIKSRAGIPVQDPFAMLFSASAAKEQTVTGVPPLQFLGNGKTLSDYQIYGNMTQNGTPTPSDPVEAESCGDLVTSGEHAGEYCIPITCGGVTQNIYLDEPLRKIGDYADEIDFQTGTVTRRIKEIVLTGSENWREESTHVYRMEVPQVLSGNAYLNQICSHYVLANSYSGLIDTDNSFGVSRRPALFIHDSRFANVAEFQSFLSAQYATGTPVTVYYVLETPTTESVTLPQIPTIRGQNTLSFGTALQPSSVSITGHIKPVTS